jgi:RNA polymerase sigma-32 factor
MTHRPTAERPRTVPSARPAASALDPLFQFALAKTTPPLNAEDERVLARRWVTAGDRVAVDKLTRANLRTVTSLATKYRHYGIPMAELVAEGNFGLVHALRKFAPGRGVRLATYAAHWVRAYMLAYVLSSWSIVGGVSGPLRSQVFFKCRRERARLTALHGEGDSCERALAERLGLSVHRVKEMMNRLDASDVSLDAPLHGDSPLTLLDELASTSNPEQSLHEARFRGQLGTTLASALRCLDARERYIVEMRFLADESPETSLAEIGRRFGISRERARQLEGRAKRKLRARVRASGHALVVEWAGASEQ